jgi:hypothetical protein
VGRSRLGIKLDDTLKKSLGFREALLICPDQTEQ